MRGHRAEDTLPGNESGVESWDTRLELLKVRVSWETSGIDTHKTLHDRPRSEVTAPQDED